MKSGNTEPWPADERFGAGQHCDETPRTEFGGYTGWGEGGLGASGVAAAAVQVRSRALDACRRCGGRWMGLRDLGGAFQKKHRTNWSPRQAERVSRWCPGNNGAVTELGETVSPPWAFGVILLVPVMPHRTHLCPG